MDPEPGPNNIILQLSVLLILTLINAFFAGAEMAVVSVNRNRINRLAEEGNKNAILTRSLLHDSTKFLSTIQVAITLAGFFSSASAATGISRELGKWLSGLNVPYGSQIAMVGITILLSYFTLVFGELVPKRIALQKAEAFTFLTIKPVFFISRVLSPFIRLLSLSTNGFLRLIGMKTELTEEAVTEEEIKALIQSGRDSGVFDKSEADMINSIFSFDDKIARDVMTPRNAVFTINLGLPLPKQIELAARSRHSRIPVYENTIDNIIGILHMRELIVELIHAPIEKLDFKGLLKKPFFVPDTKNTETLFRDLQESQNHMAVLIDEYGGFTGIVTVEDLVEEIVGEINDEFENIPADIEMIGEGVYMLEGSALIKDLNEQLGLELQAENYDTLSGCLIEQLGYIPSPQAAPVIQTGRYIFEVKKTEDNRISKVQLRIQP